MWHDPNNAQDTTIVRVSCAVQSGVTTGGDGDGVGRRRRRGRGGEGNGLNALGSDKLGRAQTLAELGSDES